MKRNTIPALAAALCLLCTQMPVIGLPSELSTVSAAEEKLTYGDLTYEVEDGCITISGCSAKAETVEIPTKIEGQPVTKIGATAFYGCDLTSIVIPEGITCIASGAFWHSTKLADVTLPSTLETIESFAFNDCAALETIDIPKSVTYIGNSAFGDTPWLAAQKAASPYVIVNGILLDASEAVNIRRAEIAAEKEQAKLEAEEKKIWKRSLIITNQLGYFPERTKKATLVTAETTGVAFDLLDADGKVVFSGTSVPHGFDVDSGDTVQILDFSAFTAEGIYTLKAETGETSHEFTIGVTDQYSGLLYDSLNFFYQQRSGIAIEEQYITSGDTAELARAAGHAPDVAEIQNVWGYEGSSGTQDVTGGWYDAGDHGKYVVNGGISVWLMQNEYERALAKGTAAAYADGSMKIPENANGYPDLLDEARYEMEWMLKMIVQDGDCKDMAYHKIHDAKWTALGTEPAKDKQDRILMPPTTAATLNLAACGAQAYRLWKDLDPNFAESCLTAAKNAYTAAQAHPDMLAPLTDSGGGGAYGDEVVSDEFYWAACELYAATGDTVYYTDLQNSDWAFAVPMDMNGVDEDSFTGSFDWGHTASLGSLTLTLHPDVLSADENAALNANLTKTADVYAGISDTQGYGVPFKANLSGYIWGSNSFIADNAVILAYAYDATGNDAYLNGVISAMDYILGRNPLDISYVTGYGLHTAQYPHHRFWAKVLKYEFPKAPCGVLVGGANSGMEDDIVKKTDWVQRRRAPQLRYLDDIEAYSVNECAINWNTALAWAVSYLCEQNGGIIVGQSSTGVQIPEPEPDDPNRIDPITITIPDGVTTVGEQIFGKTNSFVTEVIIPEGVKSVSKEAFLRCTHLESLTLPTTIEGVGDKAFAETPWLTGMLAESPLLILNGILIDGTTATGDVEIPRSVTTILGSAFKLNTNITSVVIPTSVKQIGDSAFYGCESLTSVSLPNTLNRIGESAFAGTGLTSLVIPAGVKIIGDEAFVNCKALPEVTVESTSVVIGREAFGCTSTFTANGQYSYIFIHRVLEDFVVKCAEGSTADSYAAKTGLKTSYITLTAPTGECGDVNLDGEIDILDCIMLNKHLLGSGTLNDAARAAADANSDGDIDSTDSLVILKYVVKLIDTLPALD